MAKKPLRISEAEWEVMEVVWSRSPVGANEIIDALRGKKWAPNTLRTLLARLTKKGAVEFRRDGNRYIYRPAVTREEMVERESQSFLQRVFQGAARPLLLHFAGKVELTSREIDDLRALLEKKPRRKPRS